MKPNEKRGSLSLSGPSICCSNFSPFLPIFLPLNSPFPLSIKFIHPHNIFLPFISIPLMPKMRAPQSPFLLISTLLLSFILFAAANSAAIATAVAADTATETSTEHSDADDDDESSSPPTPEDDDEGFHMVELVHMHDPRIPGNENLNLDKYEALRERVLTSVAKRHHDSHHKINKKKKKKTDWSSPGMIQMVMKTGFDYLSSEYFVQVFCFFFFLF